MTTTTQAEYRGFTPDLEVRKAAQGGDGRTIYGIAVPWDTPMRIDQDLTEQFARGAADHQFNAARRIKFARDHIPLGGVLLGAATVLRNDSSGLYGEWRVARTSEGDDALALVEAGGYDQLSVGFYPVADRTLPNGTVVRVKVNLFEVALVSGGAYGEYATVGGMRSTAAQIPAQPDATTRERIEIRAGTPVVQTPGLDALEAILRACPPLLPMPAELVK